MTKKTFKIYPSIKIRSCEACPYKVERECTFTGGPAFENSRPPKYIHDKCPIAKDEQEAA